MARRAFLFCEDVAHELFLRALVARIANDEGVGLQIETRSARGGHPKMLAELRALQKSLGTGFVTGAPDMLVAVVDGNCTGWNQKRADVEAVLDHRVFPRWAIGCPDPHIERWCFADPDAFRDIVGIAPPPDPGKCDRDLYKDLLNKTLREADTPVLATAMEVAPDIVARIDLFRAAKQQPSLGAFIRELRTTVKSLNAAT